MYWWDTQNRFLSFPCERFFIWLPVNLEKELSLILRERNVEKRTRQPHPVCTHLCVYAYSALSISVSVLVSFLLDVQNDTRMALQVAGTETKGLFMVSQLCFLCPLETGFFNVRSLLNPGFRAIFIWYKMCRERRYSEIEDSTVWFSENCFLKSLENI